MVTDAEYEGFRRLVDERGGIDVPSSRRLQLERAIERGVARNGFREASAFYHHLASEAQLTELEDFIAALTIGETHFFRDRSQFEAIATQVLPDLIQRHSHDRRLRLWSAGCSSGEEPYSLAILLDQMLPDPQAWNIHILATDIDREALKKARTGVYASRSFRDVPARFESRYFTDRDDRKELARDIRQMVRFEYLNLVEDSYPSLVNNTHSMDLVLCRNVLIYFRESAAGLVIERMHRSIVDGGWFLLGHADPSRWVTPRFSMQMFTGAVAYRKMPKAKPATVPARGPIIPKPLTRTQRPPVGRSEPSRRVRQPDPSPTQRVDRAVAVWEAGDPDRALAELETLSAEQPTEARTPYLIAKLHAGRLELEAAARWNDIAIERDNLFAPAYYLRGVLATEDGRLEDAAVALRRCTYADPQWPLGYFVLADTLLHLGQEARAAAALRTARRLVRELPPDHRVAEGDGLTAARLLELTEMQMEISALGPAHGSDG